MQDPSKPVIIEARGENIVAVGGHQGPVSQPPNDSGIPGGEAMIFRLDTLQRLANDVVSKVLGYSYTLAVQEVDGFTPELNGRLAPDHYRRRRVRLDNWQIEGIVGKTGPKNWQNMVNNAIVEGRKQIELSQNNGKWVCESYNSDFGQKGSHDILYVDLVFVDLGNGTDLEWENGAPRKASKSTVNITVQQGAGGKIEAIEDTAKASNVISESGVKRPIEARKAAPPPPKA